MMQRERYTIFYDGTCQFCIGSMNRLKRLRAAADFNFVNSRDVDAMAPYPAVDRARADGQMIILDPSGKMYGGYDGFVALAPALKTFRPLAPFLRLWPIRAIGRLVYKFIARNRHRFAGRVACEPCQIQSDPGKPQRAACAIP